MKISIFNERSTVHTIEMICLKCDIYLTIILLLKETALSFKIIQHNEFKLITKKYVALVPGQSMVFKTQWLNHVLATFRNRDMLVALKTLCMV